MPKTLKDYLAKEKVLISYPTIIKELSLELEKMQRYDLPAL